MIPTRVHPEHLGDAVRSVLVQSVADLECIVVDDGSAERPSLDPDPRLRLLYQRTSGAAAARNTGVRAASGPIVFFLDDDDTFDAYRVEHALEVHRQAPLVLCNIARWRRLSGDVHDRIANTTTPPLGTVSVERDRCVEFDESFVACEDVDWLLRQTATTRVAAIRDKDWIWRPNPDASRPDAVRTRLVANHRLVDKHAEYFAEHRRARAFRAARVSRLERDLGMRRRAFRAAATSLRTWPSRTGTGALLRAVSPRRSPQAGEP